MKKGYFETSDGAFLYYEDSEVGDTAIVLVPGHMCTTRFYEKNIPELMKEYRVVTFDCRGHGNSSKVLQKIILAVWPMILMSYCLSLI